jgi:hypothetical protein
LFGREERREQTQAQRDKSYRTFVKYRVTDVVRDSQANKGQGEEEELRGSINQGTNVVEDVNDLIGSIVEV